MARQGNLILSKDLAAVNAELIGRLLEVREATDPFVMARQRKQARNAVLYAVRRGILKRPDRCSKCGQQETEWVNTYTAEGLPAVQRIQAHHENYEKPLDVQWLCTKCHVKADQARRGHNTAPPLGDQFAAFLLIAGEYTLQPRNDPTGEVLEGYYDLKVRAIRSFRFAGFQHERPCVWVKLSCRHELLWSASTLADLATYSICSECTKIARAKSQDRAERRRARRQP